ncbi:MAG: hypothetical protein JWQ30_419 [Sediminibacterium sp.]|nr:hypothetical protein [Sediminibacterium sp.]
MKVQDVIYKGNYSIQVSFDDGTMGIVDLSDLVQKGIFEELMDQSIFAKVYTTGYSIAWSEELEIDATAIYAELSGKNPADAFTSIPSHATN